MTTELEYLLLSAIAYGDFDHIDIGSSLKDLLFNNDIIRERIFGSTSEIRPFGGKVIFNKTFSPFLQDWKLISIRDESIKYGMDKSGLYAVAFQKGDKIIISYRGSDLSSIKSAYKDLVETDLMIGVGRKPLQFDQGVFFYKSFLAAGHKVENIALTGHSLGGGIAQYSALISDKRGFGIPKVYTRNGIGIKKSGILTIEDFIEFDQIVATKYPVLLNSATVFNRVKGHYYTTLINILKTQNYIKDKENINPIERGNFKLNYDITTKTKLEDILLKNISTSSLQREFLVDVESLFGDLFSEEKIYNELVRARIFIEDYRKNDKYNKNVINFIHSDDFTSSLYPHIGTTIAVDKRLKTLNEETNPFIKKAEGYLTGQLDTKVNYILNKAFSISKSITSHHMVHVFLAFFEFEGINRGVLTQTLTLDYIASEVRNVLYQEKNLSDDLLGYYYSLNIDKMNEQNYTAVKTELVHALTLSTSNINYSKQVLDIVTNMDYVTFMLLRNKVRNKLSSPYRKLDVHDLMVFYQRKNNENIS